MEAKINNRKLEHVQWVLDDPAIDRHQAGFDRIQLIHRALPEVNYESIDTSTFFLGRHLSFPLMIGSMTGGDHDRLRTINRHLALAAQQTKVALAVGSMRIALEKPAAWASFKLRELAPDVPLLANLGAVQLNYGLGLEHCQQLIDGLQADALILHLNPLQEAIQTEGDRDFSALLPKIEALVRALPVPVIVKEVGCGFCNEDLRRLSEIGVAFIDIAGRGGTSWSRIEALRTGDELGMLMQDWGIETAQVLTQARSLNVCAALIASGGVRHGLDMIKSLVLGAQLAGVAKPFLKPALESSQHVVQTIELLKREFKVGMFLLGQSHVGSLVGNSALILENGYE